MKIKYQGVHSGSFFHIPFSPLSPLVLLAMILLQGSTGTSLGGGNMMTNEIYSDETMQEEPELPYCRRDSACGYLQVNALGVSSMQFCRCPKTYEPCSLTWDPEDGHSVTRASEQYKYCGPSPRLELCGPDQNAYTAAYLFDKSTFMTTGVLHELSCYCPSPAIHLRADMTEGVLGDEMVMATIHTCTRPHLCSVEEPCKEVSITGPTALVSKKCRCSQDLACPTLGPHLTSHTLSYSRGTAYSIYCQGRR
ncbi:U-scoloptoxin(11)-Sm5a-like [Oratosquilla oratoria]|uniref:U-scoloptoxin(11)-Sm5a-like n=1 Tax=Oratosquilla oratoria TaxID=337810 RepID=UPI003F7780D7